VLLGIVVSYCLLIKGYSWSHGGIPLAWPPTHGAARPHESSRDSFQLCRACSSSMASAIVERTVVGVIESRGAVLCLGCSVVSGMGFGGWGLGSDSRSMARRARRARLRSMLGWEAHCSCGTCGCVWLGSCGSLLSPVQPGIGFASRLLALCSFGGREAAGRSIHTYMIHTYIPSSRHALCSPLAIACTYPDNTTS
jgi:hypothetical protein